MNAPVTVPVGVQIAQGLFNACYPHGRLVAHSETQWESAAYSGASDTFVIRFEGVGSTTLAQGLVELIEAENVPIPGVPVVDLTAVIKPYGLDRVDVVVTALTLEGGA